MYLQFKLLPESCRPAIVVRDDGATLLTVDPRSTRGEVSMTVPDHLTEAEMNAFRAAYGQPPVGQPIDEDLCNDEPAILLIPESLRLRPAFPSVSEKIREAREEAARGMAPEQRRQAG